MVRVLFIPFCHEQWPWTTNLARHPIHGMAHFMHTCLFESKNVRPSWAPPLERRCLAAKKKKRRLGKGFQRADGCHDNGYLASASNASLSARSFISSRFDVLTRSFFFFCPTVARHGAFPVGCDCSSRFKSKRHGALPRPAGPSARTCKKKKSVFFAGRAIALSFYGLPRPMVARVHPHPPETVYKEKHFISPIACSKRKESFFHSRLWLY